MHSTLDPQFAILFNPDDLNDKGELACHPGSVFEGTVKITIEKALPADSIKLLFGAFERVNHLVMGWPEQKQKKEALFLVSTQLWTSGTGSTLEAGEHMFPFVCKMPMINFPPSLKHYIISVYFQMHVAIYLSDYSQPVIRSPRVHISYQPLVETLAIKNSYSFTGEKRLSKHTHIKVHVPDLVYNTNTDSLLSIGIQLFQSHVYISKLSFELKQYLIINYNHHSKVEETLLAQSQQSVEPGSNRMLINLEFPTSIDQLLPTTSFSSLIRIEYKLIISYKARYGPICNKKVLFELPVVFGTLPIGISSPRCLQNYLVKTHDPLSIEAYPTFLKPNEIYNEPVLPVYEKGIAPPSYYECCLET